MKAMYSRFIWSVSTLISLTSLSAATTPKQMEDLKRAAEKSAREAGIDPDNLQPGQTLMVPPELTDEEEGSRHMPEAYKCDGCKAVSYQFEKAFKNAEKKLKKKNRLSDADVLLTTEEVCEKRLSEYGLKSTEGKKKLSGKGLKADKKPGIMEGGGKWEARCYKTSTIFVFENCDEEELQKLKTQCGELIEMHEEEGIYTQYKNKGSRKLHEGLCNSYCTEGEIHDEDDHDRDEL